MELIDVGVNLAHESFRGDLTEVLRRAEEANVVHMVITGTSAEKSRSAAELARAHGKSSTAGVHPHDASSFDEPTCATLRELAAREEVVAIGECGLDYNRDFSPRPAQREAFAAQLRLAAELGLPVFLHERDAHEDFVAILREHRSSLPAAVVHCFTGSGEALDAYLALDCHVGITGWICDERRGLHLRELVGRIPPGRLLLETDAPFLLPRTIRPKPRSRRNEPAYLRHVLATVAEARGEPTDHVAAHTTAAARALFGL